MLLSKGSGSRSSTMPLSSNGISPNRSSSRVQAHLDDRTVRAVLFRPQRASSAAYRCARTGGPVTVPVGEPVLGRFLDVTGRVRDNGPPLPAQLSRSPIHRSAADRRSQSRRRHLRDRARGAAQQPRCGADKNSGWNAQQVSFRNGRNERKMIASSSGREGLIARPDPSSKPAGTVNCGMMRRRQCRCGASIPSFAAVSIT